LTAAPTDRKQALADVLRLLRGAAHDEAKSAMRIAAAASAPDAEPRRVNVAAIATRPSSPTRPPVGPRS
jgi:hypothetical protein